MEYAVDELAMKKITKSKTKKRIRTNISWSILKIKDNMSEKSKRLTVNLRDEGIQLAPHVTHG